MNRQNLFYPLKTDLYFIYACMCACHTDNEVFFQEEGQSVNAV